MRVLIIQLARLGDIYMSWPLMRALKRVHPEAQIDLLTRDKFKQAADGLEELNQHFTLDTKNILEPVAREGDVESSLANLRGSLQKMNENRYDVIVNLTFSPVSSYITQALTHSHTQVFGYTRHQDDSLALVDDVSTYFYSQVGVNGANRIHIADIYAAMLGFEYQAEDWRAPVVGDTLALPASYAAMHIGTSAAHKTMKRSEIVDFITEFGASSPGVSLVLLGTESEFAALNIQNLPEYVVNLCGQTSLMQVFEVLSHAEILVGGDSAPMHMAALTDTPCFNISLGAVNSWETGPKSSLGYVYHPHGETYGADAAHQVSAILSGSVPEGLMVRQGGTESYEIRESAAERFAWNLVQALHLGASYPVTENIEMVRAAQQLHDLSSFIEAQTVHAQKVGVQTVAPLLEQAEELVFNISRICPDVSPMVNWYLGEKVRIPPGSLEDIISATLRVHQQLRHHLAAYCPDEGLLKDEVYDGTL